MLNRNVGIPLIIAFLVLSACGSPEAEAEAESVRLEDARATATIEEAEGLVRVTLAGGGGAIEAEEDMELAQGDRVTTLADGAATISFLDDHLVKLSANSVLLIEEIRPRSVSGALWARVRLLSGRLLASLGELAGEDSGFTVSTPTAVAAVKGTTFSVEAQGEDTTVSVLEGAVDAASITGDGKWGERLRLEPGHESVIRKKMKGRPVARKIAHVRAKIINKRLKAMRMRALQYRKMRKSGELKRLRRLRHLSRQGKLDQASPEVKRFLKKNPKAGEKLRKFQERRSQIQKKKLVPAKRAKQVEALKKAKQAEQVDELKKKQPERLKKLKSPASPKRKLPMPKRKLPGRK